MRARYPELADDWVGKAAHASTMGLLLGIASALLLTWREVVGSIGTWVFAGMAVILLVGLLAGWLAGIGRTSSERTLMALATANRNIAAALVIAASIGGDTIVYTLVGAPDDPRRADRARGPGRAPLRHACAAARGAAPTTRWLVPHPERNVERDRCRTHCRVAQRAGATRTVLGLYVTPTDAYEMWKAEPDLVHILDVRIFEENMRNGCKYAGLPWGYEFHPDLMWVSAQE